MNVHSTPIEGLKIIEPDVYTDDRGFFLESYNKHAFAQIGIEDEFVQDNHSFSTKNVLRGLHFQRSPHAQAKLVRVITGIVFDVAVDIRPNSDTFGQWYGVELSAFNKKMFYIPTGFAHGFCVLSDTADFVYKCTTWYNKDADGGVLWSDPAIGIEWPIDTTTAIISEKDQQLPLLQDIKK